MRQDRGTLQIFFFENHNTHGWIISALLREMVGLEGQAMFECVEVNILFNRCLRHGSVEAPRLWQKPGECEGSVGKEKNGHPFRFGRAKGTSDM